MFPLVIEDEHDVVWFKLKKGEQYECTVCTQVFQVIEHKRTKH